MIFASPFSFSSTYHVLTVRVPLYFSALLYVCLSFFLLMLFVSIFVPPSPPFFFLHFFLQSCLLTSLHVFFELTHIFNPFFPFSQLTCLIISPPLPCLYFFFFQSISSPSFVSLSLSLSMWRLCRLPVFASRLGST